MSNILTEEMVVKLCAALRLVEMLENDKEDYVNDQEKVDIANKVREKTKIFMDMLTEEQLNYLLERHKLQNDYLDKEDRKMMEREEKEENEK